MEIKRPFFSVLVVVFNGPFDILERNVKNNTFKDVEFIIMDNSTNDSYYASLVTWHKDRLTPEEQKNVKIHKADYNGGYTRGNNLAFTKSRGKYLVILNPDMELGREFLTKAYKLLQGEKWSIISPKVFHNFKERVIASGLILSKHHGILSGDKRIGANKKDDGLGKKIYEAFYAHGGCIIVKREVFKRLRGFDEYFFMYVEEVDFCTRARKIGIKTVYSPILEAAHYHPGSGILSVFSGQLVYRNIVAYSAKNYGFLYMNLKFLLSFPRLLFNIIDKTNRCRCRVYLVKRVHVFIKALLQGYVMGMLYFSSACRHIV